MAVANFTSHLTEVQSLVNANFDSAAQEIKESVVEWIQYQMLYGYHDRHGPDGHTEILDTGALFESIKAEAKKDSQNLYTVEAGSDLGYAKYVHNGTRKLKGRAFIRDALNEHRQDIRKIIQDNMNSGM